MMAKSYNVKIIEFNLKKGVAFICSSSLTTLKLFMSSPLFLILEWNTLTSQEKFENLQRAFEGSKKDVPMPENPSEYSKSIMKAFGFKSWEKFCEGGNHVTIDLDMDKNEYHINPMVYVKEQGSLVGAKSGDEKLSIDASPEELIFNLGKVLGRIPQLTDEYYTNSDVSDD
jgi:hypothetical protein